MVALDCCLGDVWLCYLVGCDFGRIGLVRLFWLDASCLSLVFVICFGFTGVLGGFVVVLWVVVHVLGLPLWYMFLVWMF